MIVDSSAIVAIMRGEAERDELLARIAAAPTRTMSAASYVEIAIVIDAARDPVLSARLDQLLAVLEVEVVAVTPAQARIARQAYRDYGRGGGHPARLNFGDCLAYALAVDEDEPLLYTGEDFAHTDVRPAG